MKKYLFLLILLSGTTILQAQEIQLISQQVPQEASFAQPFEVQFALSHTPGYTPQVEKESLPKDFELIQEKTEPLSPGTWQYTATFLPFTLGVSTFTAVNIQLTDKSGQNLPQTATEPQTVKINPVQYFKDKDLRDIRPPYIPTSWLWWVLCLLVAAVLFYWLQHMYKRVRQQATKSRTIVDNRPADEIALSKIQLLLQSGLWEKAHYKMFYIELGNILREYFWRRFKLDVSSDTSAELIRRARKTPQLAPLLTLLRDYLNSSDLVKFAKVIPSQATMQQDVSAVQTLIKQTTPTLEEILPQEESK